MIHIRPHTAAYLGVGIGVLVASTAAVLIRLAQADNSPSLTIAAWRLVLASLALAPVVLVRHRAELGRLTRREWASALASGLLLALHFAAWITSLAYTSVAASVVLVSSSPLFVGLASHWLLHERLTRRMVTALLVAVAGSVFIGLGDVGESAHQLWGNVLALVGAMAAAGYFLIGRRLRARLSLLIYVFPVYGTAALGLLILSLLSGVPILPQRSQTWLWLILLALGPQIVGHSSLNWALRYLSTTYVALTTLGEPIGATLLAWWLLQESPSPWAVVGGVLVLSGIAIASRSERPAETLACLSDSSAVQ